MTRTLSTAVATAISQATGTACYLFEFEFSGGTVRYATAASNIAWSGNTYVAVGGALSFEVVEESRALAASVRVVLDGVDQTIISAVLSNTYVGRQARIYLAHFDSNGALIDDPVLYFAGMMNGRFEVSESPPGDDGEAGTCRVTTLLSADLTGLAQKRGIRSELNSHRRVSSGDGFFRHLPSLPKEAWWGREPIRRPAIDPLGDGSFDDRRIG